MDTIKFSWITFQVLLFENSNNILFQYQRCYGQDGFHSQSSNGGFATVGIEDPTGVTGIEYSYNQPVITDGLAILFSYPTVVSNANMFVSINAPVRLESGSVNDIHFIVWRHWRIFSFKRQS